MFNLPSSENSLIYRSVSEQREAFEILLIDENEEARRLIRSYLEPGGEIFDYRVMEAARAEEAIELYINHRPALILLAYDSSGAVGAEFFRALKTNVGDFPAPMILLTETEEQSLPVAALKAGVRDFLVKPGLAARELHRLIEGTLQQGSPSYDAEQALREAQRQLGNNLENMTEAYTALNSRWRVTYTNRASSEIFQKLTGLQPEQYLGMNHWDIFPSLAGQEIQREYERAVREQVAVHLEVLYEPTGDWFEVHAYPSPSGLGVYFRGITERKRADIALQQSEQRFRTLADNISQFAWMADETGALFWYNQRWYEYTGTTFEEMQGWGWQKVHHPEHVERVTQRFKDFVARGELWEDTFPLLGKDGRYRWFLSRAMPIKDETGRVVLWFGTNTDIDDLKRTEEELEESKSILDALMEYIPEGITIADAPDVTIRRISRYGRELTGRPSEYIQGIPVQEHTDRWDIYYPDGLTRPEPEQLPLSRAVQRGEVVLDEEFILQQPSGKKINLLCNAAPIRDSEGVITGGIIAWRDISDRKQAELVLKQQAQELAGLNATLKQTTAQLQERNQELDRFTYTVSHDLKAPLRAISSLAQWLAEDLEGELSGENQHNLQLLQERVARMDELINGLLAYSRIGRTELPSEEVKVGELLNEVIDSLAPPPGLIISIGQEMPTLTTKRLFLFQVFSNLIGNAIKHCERKDGRIEIGAVPRGGYYEFTVSDNGVGIPQEDHELIFEMFKSLKEKEAGKNTGIGLSLVKKIVETEGGTIEVESSPGKGATFRFTWSKIHP